VQISTRRSFSNYGFIGTVRPRWCRFGDIDIKVFVYRPSNLNMLLHKVR
jgi:hypothetical protein